jgi:hypothetical protein
VIFFVLPIKEFTMVWIKWFSLFLGTLLILAAGISAYGTWRWTEGTKLLMSQLEANRLPPLASRYDARDLEGLPAPVQRYFRTALKDGQAIIVAAKVAHTGTFNMGETTDQWKPFTSQQRVVTRAPGFVWDGRVVMMPGLPVNVHDAYVAGEGILHPAILGLFTLMDLRGTGDVAQGELMRFFVEALWYPTALLPSQGVRWGAVDERSAKATMVDGDQRLTLLFRFNEQGLIESGLAEARGRTVKGKIVMTPWEGRFSNFQERDGMLVPLSGEVAWLTPEGRKPYWRGTITQLVYEFAK